MKNKFIFLFSIISFFYLKNNAQYIRAWDQDYPAISSLNSITAGLPGFMYVTGSTYSPITKLDVNFIKIDTSGNILWQYDYNYSDSLDDGAGAVLHDGTGNIYSAGYSTIDTSAGAYTDIIALKINDSGNLVWQQQYDGPQHMSDITVKARLDSYNNLIVSGWSLDTTIKHHSVLLKYDISGTLLWQQLFPLSQPIDMDIDNNNNIYVLSYADFLDSLRILKYDSSGNLLWNTAIAENTFSGFNFITVDHANNEVVATGGIATPLVPLPHISMVKMDTAGNIKWVKHILISPDTHTANSVKIDVQGNIYTGGDHSPPGLYFLNKTNAQGDSIWTTYFNPGGVYPQGSLVDFKLFNNNKIFISTAASYYDGSVDCYNQESFIADTSGTILFQDVFDSGVGDDNFYAIGIDNAPGIYLTGNVYDTAQGTSSGHIIKYVDFTLNSNYVTDNNILKVYPNPSDGNIKLTLQAITAIDAKLQVFNYTGKCIMSTALNLNHDNNTALINLQNLPGGIYFLKLTDGNFYITQPLVIIK